MSDPELVPPPSSDPPAVTAIVVAGGSSSDKYIPIYVLTAVFGAIFAFGPLLVRKGPNKQLIRVCIMMSAFCMYLFWVTAYIAQMNPLTGPRLHNSTLAWYQYKFGKNVAKPKEYKKGADDEQDTTVVGDDLNESEQPPTQNEEAPRISPPESQEDLRVGLKGSG